MGDAGANATPITDRLGRRLRDLRISVTDRCNFRCTYCMPKEVFGQGYRFLERSKLLSYEEIERLVRLFLTLGVRKIRLTGGEPLVRRDLPVLIQKIAALDGIEDISLTTNASLLTEAKATALREAGLHRITVSLDALDDAVFRSINDVGFSVERVLRAIDHGINAGLLPVKVNMVVKRGINEADILPMVDYFRRYGDRVILRFIEFMDVGDSNGWRLDDVVSAAEIAERIDARFPIEPVDANYVGEVAQRWRFRNGQTEIGIISSVSQPFCGSCSRARLSAAGRLYHCLFASDGFNLLDLIRRPGGIDDDELTARLTQNWVARDDRYSLLRTEFTARAEPPRKKIEMSYIGG